MKFSDKEKNRLKTKYGSWAIVTGATSGIGKELALRLGEAGLNVIIHGRREAALEAVKSRLDSYGVDSKTVISDLSNSEGVEKLIQASQYLDVGMLIANAGFGTSGNFIDNSLHSETNMLRVNCEAVLMMTHHFSRYFVEKKRGGIVLLSSLVAFQGVPYSANYAASKAYIQSLAEALAVELKPHGVDVLSAAPGPVASGFAQRADMKMDMSLTPEQVGLPILKALGRKGTVVPGFLSKILVYSLATAPRWAKVRIMKAIMGGMTSHQREGKTMQLS